MLLGQADSAVGRTGAALIAATDIRTLEEISAMLQQCCCPRVNYIWLEPVPDGAVSCPRAPQLFIPQ